MLHKDFFSKSLKATKIKKIYLDKENQGKKKHFFFISNWRNVEAQ